MPLIVEDGSGVTSANSYITLAEARAYATDRGVTLPADDGKLTPFLVNAADYLELFASSYVGTPTNTTQGLQWPRADVSLNDEDYPDDEIPAALKIAQIRLVMEQARGVDIMPTTTGRFVKKEKVGPLETEYSEAINVSGAPHFPFVESLLSSLFSHSSGFALTTVRV